MDKLEALYVKFQKLGVGPQTKSLLLLKPRDALNLICTGVAASNRLLRVEGFWLLPSGAIQPDMGLIYDVDDFNDEKEFLRAVGGLLLGEITNNGVAFEIGMSAPDEKS
ncbi:hypothetical protein [Varunaivibrio sulfuroxidans]|uniref:Uncharacterized protein n=1 Tax=Varunaivibrio sulfuroxidans TaxID=1773489 RepID=A0A4R3JB56_9PROT|nr:hypothetical protein [Varunaivibrio sulfuroxidans]TCS62912.1 hypothetical protein EDD55_1041 [Varunaivibrio sulfuroxidans]WES32009.1 hypothetical protein P3M64_06545 [Varunaivibrio sulfuroxidans]